MRDVGKRMSKNAAVAVPPSIPVLAPVAGGRLLRLQWQASEQVGALFAALVPTGIVIWARMQRGHRASFCMPRVGGAS